MNKYVARRGSALILGKGWVAFNGRASNVTFAQGLRAVGRPIIRLHRGATLTIGRDVTLNSFRHGYHAAMTHPVTLIADADGARISVGANSRINGAVLHAQDSIEIGNRVLIAAQATILDSNGHVLSPASARLTMRDRPRPVVIEDDVWIGLGATVLPGSVIGAGTVIGAHCVVSGYIPPHSVVRQSNRIDQLR